MKTGYREISAYVTKDGSEIRELMHPAVHGNRNQSLAQATIPAGTRTRLHLHRTTEEIYHVVAGAGVMTLDGAEFDIATGDSILIAPGTAHCVETVGAAPLRILCCCSPAYSDSDTELLP